MDVNRSPLSVTVAISTHNRPEMLERCLQALRRIRQLMFSIHVIDNGRNSDAAECLAARYGAEYWISPIQGLSRAHHGSPGSQSDLIAYLDDDMIPSVDWLNGLLGEFADESIMAVTGPVLPMGLVDADDAKQKQAIEATPWGPNRFQLDRSSSLWFERTNFGGIGDGNLALRSTAFRYFHGFDERLGRGMP